MLWSIAFLLIAGKAFSGCCPELFCQNCVPKNFAKLTGKRLVRAYFNNFVGGAFSFIKKKTLPLVISCEFCEIFINTYFEGHLWPSASNRVTALISSCWQKRQYTAWIAAFDPASWAAFTYKDPATSLLSFFAIYITSFPEI